MVVSVGKQVEYVYEGGHVKDVIRRTLYGGFELESYELVEGKNPVWCDITDETFVITRAALVAFFGEDAVQRLEARLSEKGE